MAQERLSEQESIVINQTMTRSGKDTNQKTMLDGLTTTATTTTAIVTTTVGVWKQERLCQY